MNSVNGETNPSEQSERVERIVSRCRHNKRSRYTHGFYCRDCNTFFTKASATYRSSELLVSIWMVLKNINAVESRAGRKPFDDVAEMMGKIGIGIRHGNFEELIAEAEVVMTKYGKNSESASMTIGG